MYEYKENGVVVKVYPTLPQNWKNISNLPSLPEDRLNGLGFFKVEKVLTLEEAKLQKRREIDLHKAIQESQGVPITFPDGRKDVVQMRNERDALNLNALFSRALFLKSTGVTSPVICLRCEENITYHLTPDQVIQIGKRVSEFSEALYVKAWTLKDSLNSMTTIEQVEGVVWV